ncbi:MAG TPA: hypothetical protein VFQ20_11770 [Burkholderiaceae bacterium]|nr:hypothetical protein [Burkholderiaceae bacterium]
MALRALALRRLKPAAKRSRKIGLRGHFLARRLETMTLPETLSAGAIGNRSVVPRPTRRRSTMRRVCRSGWRRWTTACKSLPSRCAPYAQAIDAGQRRERDVRR